jgi:hypothetical protein
MSKMSVERQLTIMLIAVAVAFIVLRLPYTITFYLNNFKTSIWPGESKWFYYNIYAANKIADTLATLNYAINFFLYYVCGNVFRKQLELICKCAICGSRDFERQRSFSSSMRMTIVPNYSRTLSGGRPESPRPSPKTDKGNVFSYMKTINGNRLESPKCSPKSDKGNVFNYMQTINTNHTESPDPSLKCNKDNVFV